MKTLFNVMFRHGRSGRSITRYISPGELPEAGERVELKDSANDPCVIAGVVAARHWFVNIGVDNTAEVVVLVDVDIDERKESPTSWPPSKAVTRGGALVRRVAANVTSPGHATRHDLGE
ncbi:hypothetical protein [Actinoplanes missouriensis]|uniref:hypothetical protein n=1 Tax=Actinoplanes missouriensis TaxID=1866 RepID=UPI0012FCC0C2|nr:hypothetical protein [Actinoplanes missouriensis]